ncbi:MULTISPECIES: helix-turn-helix domain-containing protein [unclassified Ruegeria]|uniref:helix-turn-helix domain-containing protein n=1 Tax=unclassified Ruegeria TaxID=2625375 RepID=UPI0020C3AD56|nr:MULTISPECIES: helix-turn-helix transcriptional regulator [unclassified Ruegeria]
MTNNTRSPAELRKMFGANLRRLARQYPSVSELCRQLGINRTQFNRYLGGESFPRPDVLDRICNFFEVDARILLRPIDEIDLPPVHPAASALTEFLGSGPGTLTENLLPAGFYFVSETGLDEPHATRHRVLHARRLPQCTLVRSYEPPSGEDSVASNLREVQGIAACAGRQIYILMSSRASQNSRIYLVKRGNDAQSDQWRGVAICLSKTTANDTTMRRLALRYLGPKPKAALSAARAARRAERTAEEIVA